MMSDASSKRILVKGTGGLGNRMLSVLTASLFAVLSKRRLWIDWRDPIFTGRSGIAPDLFCELFVSPLADPLPETIHCDSVTPELWRGRLDETLGVVGRDHDPLFYKKFGSFRELSVRLRKIEYPEELLVFWSWREVMRPLRPHLVQMDRRYASLSNVAILRETAQRYLQPTERVNSMLQTFVGEHFRGKMLGLHIRATDLQAPVEKLLKIASRMVKKHQCDGVFCATDNADVEQRVRDMMPNVVTLPKKLPKGAVPLHYDPDCQNRVETATQALLDILLLSRCQNLVYASRSSFGYVASLYAPDGQVVVDADQFHPTIQAKRYLQSWVH
jgi:hypothetical protein